MYTPTGDNMELKIDHRKSGEQAQIALEGAVVNWIMK